MYSPNIYIFGYSQIQVINGVILVSWRQAVLQKQIDYGARLGHVVLSLAKMELDNFFKNVMPVADYYDQSDMLIAVSTMKLISTERIFYVKNSFFQTLNQESNFPSLKNI